MASLYDGSDVPLGVECAWPAFVWLSGGPDSGFPPRQEDAAVLPAPNWPMAAPISPIGESAEPRP